MENALYFTVITLPRPLPKSQVIFMSSSLWETSGILEVKPTNVGGGPPRLLPPGASHSRATPHSASLN